jgi:amino acid permease
MNVTKALTGVVFLGIPYVFIQTGVIGGIILYFILYIVNTYTMSSMVECSRFVKRTKNIDILSISSLAFYAFGKYGKLMIEIVVLVV